MKIQLFGISELLKRKASAKAEETLLISTQKARAGKIKFCYAPCKTRFLPPLVWKWLDKYKEVLAL